MNTRFFLREATSTDYFVRPSLRMYVRIFVCMSVYPLLKSAHGAPMVVPGGTFLPWYTLLNLHIYTATFNQTT